MTYRPTPLVLAITFLFQPLPVRADGAGEQRPQAADARLWMEVDQEAVNRLSPTQPAVQPHTETAPSTPKTPKNKTQKNKPKQLKTRADTPPDLHEYHTHSTIAYHLTELNNTQIDEKLNPPELPPAKYSKKISELLNKNTPQTHPSSSLENHSSTAESPITPHHVDTPQAAAKKLTQPPGKKQKNKRVPLKSGAEAADLPSSNEKKTTSNSLKNETQSAQTTEAPNQPSANHPIDHHVPPTPAGSLKTAPKRNWKFWQRNPPSDEQGEQDTHEKELTPNYPIEIQTNNEEINQLLKQHLPIISYQKREEMDDEQISYLAEDTPKDVQNLVRTEGYFNAKTRISPTTQPENKKGYRVDVDLGQRTTVDNVNVAIVGDVLQDNQLGAYYKQAFTGWKLPVGAHFRQEDWSASKVSVLSAITRKKYPLAKLSQTQATINPNTHQADLNVMVDSQQPIYFGELDISGHQRYPQSVISGLADFKAGDEYDLDKLLDYQQALENDSHYSGASVQADFDEMVNNRVPIKVQVSEVKRQKLEAGLRFDSEYGLGGKLGYDHYNLFNRGYVGSVSVEADKYQTTTGIGISQPRDAKGRYLTSNLTYNRSTTQNLEKRTISTGIWHVQDKGDTEWRFGLEFLGEDSHVPDTRIELGKSFATMVTGQWKKHQLETQMRPQNGYYADVKLGSTPGKLGSSSLMARAYTQAGYYFTPENKQLGTIAVRGALGYVYTNKQEANGQVPTSLMFRTGGAGTVRGYELDSIGRKLPNSLTVLPNRAMASASFEYQYPIQKKLMGQEFAIAAFHDMGGVARTFKHMQWQHGTGLGLRWYSPVAPFSFDLAYGHQDKRLRWHISLGTRF